MRRGGSDVRLLLRAAVSQPCSRPPRLARAELRLRRGRAALISQVPGDARTCQRRTVRDRAGHVGEKRGQLGLRLRGPSYLTRRSDGVGMEPCRRTESCSRTRALSACRRSWRKLARTGSRAWRTCSSRSRCRRSCSGSPSVHRITRRATRTSLRPLFGKFPHLVNRTMIEQIKPVSDEYVECISARGLPQRLFNRFTHEPMSIPTGPTRWATGAVQPLLPVARDARRRGRCIAGSGSEVRRPASRAFAAGSQRPAGLGRRRQG